MSMTSLWRQMMKSLWQHLDITITWPSQLPVMFTATNTQTYVLHHYGCTAKSIPDRRHRSISISKPSSVTSPWRQHGIIVTLPGWTTNLLPLFHTQLSHPLSPKGSHDVTLCSKRSDVITDPQWHLKHNNIWQQIFNACRHTVDDDANLALN